MKYLSIIFLSLSTYIPAIEYSSLHDQTYWYYDDEIADEGWHMGTVRSNLVQSDKLRFVIAEGTCDHVPTMFLTLTSNQIREVIKTDRNFNIKNLEGRKITFKSYIDKFDPFMINATINIADEVDSVSSKFLIEFDDGMPRNFVSYSKRYNSSKFIEVMMLEIPEDDPNYKYFDLTQIKFRMGGLVNVWMHAHELCLDTGENYE